MLRALRDDDRHTANRAVIVDERIARAGQVRLFRVSVPVVAEELILEHGSLAAAYGAFDERLEPGPQVGAQLAQRLAHGARTGMGADERRKSNAWQGAV